MATPKYLVFENYINRIKLSEGSRLFRNIFCEINSNVVDVTIDGEISCGVHVSNILLLVDLRLIKSGHATIESTLKDMLEHGWHETSDLKKGVVILWEMQQKSSGSHMHLGFYIGNEEAISNLDHSYGTQYPGCPNRHHYTFSGTRKIEKIFWNDLLNI